MGNTFCKQANDIQAKDSKERRKILSIITLDIR
jgi:hypothetical protein